MAIYGPGGYYLFGGIFLLFGASVIVARILTGLIMAGAALMIYLVTRRLSNSAYGLAAYLAAIIWFGNQPLNARTIAPALLLSFAFLLSGVGTFERPTPRGFFTLGIWSGLILVFRHDLGLDALFASLVVLVWRDFRIRSEGGGARPRASLFKEAGLFLSGAMIIALLIVMGSALYVYAVYRLDLEHIIPTYLISLILLAALAASSPLPRWRVFFAAFIVLCVSWTAVLKVQTLVSPREPALMELQIPRGRGIKVPPDWGKSLEDAVRYIDEHTTSDERIFVACPRHDQILLNDAMFYFLAGRLPGTRFHELVRGIATQEDVQRQIIEDLVRSRVRYVIVSSLTEIGESKEKNRRRLEPGSHLLDTFLEMHFRPDMDFGSYKILKNAAVETRAGDRFGPIPFDHGFF